MNEATRSAEPLPAPAQLLPHGPSMVFIERIVERGETHVVCEVVPGTNDASHARDGVIPATMSVEYMAQTVSLYAGLRAPPGQRREVGYVIAVRALKVRAPSFALGVPLKVRAQWQWGEDRLGRFETSISRGDETIASAFMSVYRPTPEEMA